MKQACAALLGLALPAACLAEGGIAGAWSSFSRHVQPNGTAA